MTKSNKISGMYVRMPTTSFFSIFCACIASSCYFCYFNLKKSILHGFFKKSRTKNTPFKKKGVPKTPLFKKKRYQKHVEKWYQKHVENTYKKLLILKGVIPL